MTNEEIKSVYLNAEKVVSLMETPYGKELRKNNPNIYDIANKTVEEYRDRYYEIKLNESESAKELLKSSEDAIQVLKIIPETSHETILNLNNLITSNSEKLQNELLFNTDTFYEKYFLSLPAELSDEINEEVLKNPRFTEWFGNSKVVDSNGKPLLVYHGTGGDIDEFTQFKFNLFPGAYFAENKSYSDWFANIKGGGSYMFRCYLRVQNPIDLTPFELRTVTYEDLVNYIKFKYGYTMPENKMLKAMSNAENGMWVWRYLRAGVDWLKFIKNTGEFDGFHYYENNPNDIKEGVENSTPAWLVLSSNQIKTADMRNDTYSLFSDDIRMKEGGKVC